MTKTGKKVKLYEEGIFNSPNISLSPDLKGFKRDNLTCKQTISYSDNFIGLFKDKINLFENRTFALENLDSVEDVGEGELKMEKYIENEQVKQSYYWKESKFTKKLEPDETETDKFDELLTEDQLCHFNSIFYLKQWETIRSTDKPEAGAQAWDFNEKVV